jgi:hypothetical protein
MRKYKRFIIKRYANKYHIGIKQLWDKYRQLGLRRALKWYGVRV